MAKRSSPGRRHWPARLLAVVVAGQLAVGVFALHAVPAVPAAAAAPAAAALGAGLNPGQPTPDLAASGRTAPGPIAPGPVAPGPTAPDYSAGLGGQAATRATRTAAVAALLERRGLAVRTGDKQAFLVTIDPAATGFRAAQARLFDNLHEVPLADWGYDLDPGRQLPVTDSRFAGYRAPVWVPQVELRYALAGVDREPTRRPQVFTFVRRGTQWFIAADDDLAEQGHRTWRGLWDFGPVIVVRGRSSLVLAHPEQSSPSPGPAGSPDAAAAMTQLADTVDAAVPIVSSVWGPDWGTTVAVLVPQTQQEMAEVIGGDLELDQIAAVATSDETDAGRGLALGQRVVVNPANLDRLGAAGRRVVMQHEITHIASRASTAPDTPLWLVEGFADYVGYLDSGIPIRSAAPELGQEVRRGTVPPALPTASSFDGDAPRLAQAYEEARLGCLLIAQRVGQDGLVRFYRQAATGGEPALEAAVQDVLGTPYQAFVVDWRNYLVEQLS